MGEALPLNVAAQLPPTQTTAQTLSTLSIPTNIVSLPDGLATLSRPITVTGTIVDMLMSGELSLRTAMGTINLSLTSIQNDTIDALFDLVATPSGKSPTLELQLQPGAPPKQATLIIPKADAAKQAEETKPLFAKEPASLSLQPASKQETTLKVTVLPDDLDSKAIMAPKTEQVEGNLAQGNKGAEGNKPTLSSQDKTGEAPHAPLQQEITSKAETVIKTEAQIAQKVAQQGVASTAARGALTVGQEAKVTIAQALSPEATWPTNLGEDQIKATVIGKSVNGNMLLNADGKTLFVHDTKAYPAGTKLVLTLHAEREERAHVLPLSQDRNFAPARELAAGLQNIDPHVSQQFLQNHLPTPQHHFAGTALFLLSALVGKNFEEWLGPQTLQALARGGKQNIKDKLVDALKDASDGGARDMRVGEWKTYPIPLHYAGAFEMLRLYVHRDTAHDQQAVSAAPQIAKTRFVISVNLSRLGPIQLDGLSQKKQLDLVVRSERELPGHLTISLRETALASLEAVGLKGTILFQAGRTNWVSIEDNKIKPAAVVT